MFDIEITEPAKADIQDAFDWWKHITRIANPLPTHVQERDLSETDVRQLWFGIGRSVTHRIVFVARDNVVTILRVRHQAQDALG